MAQCGANIHDIVKPEDIIQRLRDEMQELEKQRLDLEKELEVFRNENMNVHVTEEQSVASVREFKELIGLKKNELTKLDKILTEFECQRKQLEYELDLQEQKLEDNQNKLQEKTDLLNKLQELENFENQQLCLEEQNEFLEHEKSKLQQIIGSLDEKTQQIKIETNRIPQCIEKICGETELIDKKRQNIYEDIRNKKNEIKKLEKELQDIEQTRSKFPREDDEINAELYRINHLINQISIIIELKQNNPKEFEQFKANLIKDYQQAENELKDVQEQIRPINEQSQKAKQSIQLFEQTLDKLVQESTEHENKSRLCKETIELLKQQITQKQEEYDRLKDKTYGIVEELKFEEQEKSKVEHEIKNLDLKQIEFKTEMKSISERLETMVSDRNNFYIQLNEKKRTQQKLQQELFAITEKRITAEENLRKQEQIIQNAKQQLQNCRDKNLKCYWSEQRAKFRNETVEVNLKLAEQVFNCAKENFKALEAYIETDPKAKTVGYSTKKKLVEKCQQAVKRCEMDLTNHCALHKECTQNLDKSKVNTKEVEHVLNEAENELKKYEEEVENLRNQISSIEQKILRESGDLIITVKYFQQEYEQHEEQARVMKKEIESFEQQFLIQNQKLNIIDINLKRLKRKQTNLSLNTELVKNDLRKYQQEYEEQLIKYQTFVDNMSDNRLNQTSLKRDITQQRIEMQTVEFELIREQRREYRIRGKINNFSQVSTIIDKNITDLQLEINKQKTHYNNKIQEQLKAENNLTVLEGKKSSLQYDIERCVNEARQLERDLPNKYQDLIENKLKSQRFQHDLNQFQNELQTNKDEYDQHKEDMSILTNLFNENKRNIEKYNMKISKIKEIIISQFEIEKNLKNTIENDVKEIEEKKFKLEMLTDRISDLLKQYKDGIYQQNTYLDSLKLIQDQRMNIINKLINYEQGIHDRQSKLTLINHEIDSKWNDIRNYKEKESRYTLDLYNDEVDQEEQKTR